MTNAKASRTSQKSYCNETKTTSNAKTASNWKSCGTVIKGGDLFVTKRPAEVQRMWGDYDREFFLMYIKRRPSANITKKYTSLIDWSQTRALRAKRSHAQMDTTEQLPDLPQKVVSLTSNAVRASDRSNVLSSNTIQGLGSSGKLSSITYREWSWAVWQVENIGYRMWSEAVSKSSRAVALSKFIGAYKFSEYEKLRLTHGCVYRRGQIFHGPSDKRSGLPVSTAEFEAALDCISMLAKGDGSTLSKTQKAASKASFRAAIHRCAVSYAYEEPCERHRRMILKNLAASMLLSNDRKTKH